jgi:hypothetical protein
MAAEEEEVFPKEKVIVTALKSHLQLHGVYEAIESTIQTRSRIETLGSSLYTLVLTGLMDQGIQLTETHLSQGLINACFRACCATQAKPVPPKATYKACPRVFDEKKWRAENADDSISPAQFQVLVDDATQQRASKRQAIFASYQLIETTLQKVQGKCTRRFHMAGVKAEGHKYCQCSGKKIQSGVR